MSKHVLVESNYLFDAFPPPHITEKSTKIAQNLWQRYIDDEVVLHIPHMAFREAHSAILKKNFSIRMDDIRDVYRVLKRQANDSESSLDVTVIDNFIQEADRYFQNEQKYLVKERIDNAEKIVIHRGDLIILDERVIEMLPLEVDHDMDFLDQVILACMLVRTDDIRKTDATSEIFLCNANKHHFAPDYIDPKILKARGSLVDVLSGNTRECMDLVVNCLKSQIRPKLKKLYQDRNITFLDHFFVP